MKPTQRPRPIFVWILAALLLLLSLGALGGGAGMIASPDGSLLQFPEGALEGSPFKDYLIPGIILFTLSGVYPLLVVYSLLARPGWTWPDAINPFKQVHWAWAGSLAAGLIQMIWITVQVAMLGYGFWIQPACFSLGTAIVLVTLLPPVRNYYERN